MRFIAHRGNWQGIKPELENTHEYLLDAYRRGYDVEVDVHGLNGVLYYGHDEPTERACTNFLQQPGVWCHAKNYAALILLSELRCHYFWHQTDDLTVTSDNYFWCYPGKNLQHPRAVWLDLEDIPLPEDTIGIYGICGDKI